MLTTATFLFFFFFCFQGLYLSDIQVRQISDEKLKLGRTPIANDDAQDHLITMTQNLNHYEKILSRSHSNYLAQISIEMTDANNQINDVLSKLTALGTVLVPMNLITGAARSLVGRSVGGSMSEIVRSFRSLGDERARARAGYFGMSSFFRVAGK